MAKISLIKDLSSFRTQYRQQRERYPKAELPSVRHLAYALELALDVKPRRFAILEVFIQPAGSMRITTIGTNRKWLPVG